MSQTRHIAASAAAVSPASLAPGPVRTCVGCGTRDRKAAMVRLAKVKNRGQQDATVVADGRKVLPGRGAYVHARCVGSALAKGKVARSLRTRVSAANRNSIESAIANSVEVRAAAQAEGTHC